MNFDVKENIPRVMFSLSSDINLLQDCGIMTELCMKFQSNEHLMI